MPNDRGAGTEAPQPTPATGADQRPLAGDREAACLRAVLRVVEQVNAQMDADAALNAVVDAAEELFEQDHSLILLMSPGSQFRSVRLARRLSARYRQHLTTGHLPFQRTAELVGSFSIRDLATDAPAPVAEEVGRLMAAEGFQAMTALRLQHRGEPLGVMVLYFDRPHEVPPAELRYAQLLADQAAAALVHSRDLELLAAIRREHELAHERLQAILNHIRDVIILWTPQLEVQVANTTAQQLARELGADQDPNRCLALLPPPGCCPVRQVIRDRTPLLGCEALIADRLYEVDCHPLFDERTGELVAVVQHARDVTENRALQRQLAHSEERTRLALEMAPVGILLLDVPDGRVVRSNQTFANLCGRPAPELLGQRLLELVADDDREIVREHWERVLSDGDASAESLGIRRADGGVVPVSLTMGVLQYSDGERNVHCVLRDITRRLRLQAQLIEQEKLAAIGQLASGVAHEVRNPLNIIGGALFDLQEVLSSDDPEVLEDLRIARDEIRRVQEIVNNVLDFARVGTVEREWLELGELVQQTVELLRRGLATHDIEMTCELEPLPPVWAVPGALRQVALNLITNALQATPDGGRVEVVLSPEGDEHVRLSVRDTGPGIRAEHLSRIFNPFFTTKEPGQGTGLGLSIVYTAVREHGGRVEVDSRPGEGTAFHVILPLRAPSAPVAETPLARAVSELL